MDLIINGVAVNRSSLGARRYFDGIYDRLTWPGRVQITALPKHKALERPMELLHRGRRDAIFWSPSHRGPVAAHNHVITVLDCINVEYTYRGDWRLPLFRKFFNATLNRATAIVTISSATRDAVLRNYRVDPDKVIAIPGPIAMAPPGKSGDRTPGPRATEEPPFVLMIANPLPHKNTGAALQALAASSAARRGIALRVVGSLAPQALDACRATGCSVQVHTGVDDETLSSWLSTCQFLFSPSLDEGLNLPIAEALNLGANVLCSDIPVHREFYDGQVAWFDPCRVDAMRQALDDAFDRPGPWPRRPGGRRPSFDDVTASYRQLFMRIASGGAPVSFLR
jgi:glycosyltransferase involved in cell wall biosynthesis